MLEWTGERFLPWVKESAIAYEHLHRYLFAAQFVQGKRVLDLASGEGYGSSILAAHARSVLGVDIDDNTVQHARAKYERPHLHFMRGSVCEIPVREDHCFDVVVCFEAIEHIEDQEKLLQEVKRLLTGDGLFVVSTPHKSAYREESHEDNPFHLKELEFDEFNGLLSRHFRQVRFLGQRIHPGSSIWPLQSETESSVREFVVGRAGPEFEPVSASDRIPLYYIAFASNAPALPAFNGSVLVDHSNELLNAKDTAILELQESKAASQEALNWRERELKQRDQSIESLQKAADWRNAQIAELTEGLEWTRSAMLKLEETIAAQEEGLAWRAHQVEDLQKEIAALRSHLETSQRQLQLVTEQLQAIQASRGWRFILRLRRLRARLTGA